jgi:N-acetylglucosaminyldiphosphoundecaprenol N-acetyl-beta-D-mannosaminyltransferase
VDTLPRERLIELILHDAFHASSTRVVATINAQFYVLAESDFVFRDCLRRSEFVCADGVSIGMAAKILARRRVERFAGVDLVEEICRRGAVDRLRIFLFGGRPGSAAVLADMLLQRYPGIEIAGISCPPVGFEKSAHSLVAALNDIAAACPHVVFVALGAPKQELFIDQYLRNLNVPMAAGVGGSFEILTGVTHRAPKAIQQAGLEWLYRLCQEPRRLWRRYLFGNPKFLFIMSRYWVLGRRVQQATQKLG